MTRIIALLVTFLVIMPAEASDISPDEVVDAFCRYFETRDVEEAFRPIAALTSAQLSITSRKDRDGNSSFNTYTTKLDADKVWEASYHYQENDKNSSPYGYWLQIRTKKAEKGLIFNSSGEMQEWLGQFGDVQHSRDINDDDVYTVPLLKIRRSGRDMSVASLSVQFDEGHQYIRLRWLMSEHLSAARSICK